MAMVGAIVPVRGVCTQEDAAGQHSNPQDTKRSREEPALLFSAKETELSGQVSRHPVLITVGQKRKTREPRCGCHQEPSQSPISKLLSKHNSSDRLDQLENSR